MLARTQGVFIDCLNEEQVRDAIEFYRKFTGMKKEPLLSWRLEKDILVISACNIVEEDKPTVINRVDDLVELCKRVLCIGEPRLSATVAEIDKEMEYAESYPIGYRVFSPFWCSENLINSSTVSDLLAVKLVGIEDGK